MTRAWAAFCLVATVGSCPSPGGADPLRYRLPDGWVDLAAPGAETARFPRNAVSEAKSGRYALYAVDPGNLSDSGAGALMNVLEIPPQGRLTPEVLRRATLEAFEQARATGQSMIVLDMRLATIRGVDVGVVDSTLGNARGTLRLVQYFFPGEPRAAVITYGCRPDEIERYRPLFEASAQATTGASASSFDGDRALRGALVGAVGGALAGLVALLFRRRNPGPGSAGAVTPPATWTCAACRRHVPRRVARCRCGQPRDPGSVGLRAEPGAPGPSRTP